MRKINKMYLAVFFCESCKSSYKLKSAEYNIVFNIPIYNMRIRHKKRYHIITTLSKYKTPIGIHLYTNYIIVK